MDVEVPAYSPAGLRLQWEIDCMITVQQDAGRTTILANRAGLLTLARHLLTLAQPEVPVGYHLHLDDSNGFEPGSSELLLVVGDAEAPPDR